MLGNRRGETESRWEPAAVHPSGFRSEGYPSVRYRSALGFRSDEGESEKLRPARLAVDHQLN